MARKIYLICIMILLIVLAAEVLCINGILQGGEFSEAALKILVPLIENISIPA